MSTAEPEGTNRRRHESLAIMNALRRGTVPAAGLSRIAVGLELEEGVIARQLDFVADGGGDLKFVRGDYGAGKTFFVARALETAAEKGFVTAHIFISPTASLSKPKVLYQQVCAALRTAETDHAGKNGHRQLALCHRRTARLRCRNHGRCSPRGGGGKGDRILPCPDQREKYRSFCRPAHLL